LYDGHAVAAVAATSPHIAEEALRLIEVDYELLPPVMTADAAMKPDAPILLPEIRQKFYRRTHRSRIARGPRPADQRRRAYPVSARRSRSRLPRGRLRSSSATFARHRASGLYRTAQRRRALQLRRPRDRLLLDPGHLQRAHAHRDRSQNERRQHQGGARGKLAAASAARPRSISSRWLWLLAKKSGRPVKMTMNRAEVPARERPNSGTWIKGKMGATRDGKITAAQFWMAYEAGAFPGSPFAPGRDVLHRPLQHPQPAARLVRRGGQPAQGRGLSRAGFAKLGVCLRIAGRRIGAALRNRST